jgi:predicted alpha/beta hydrolase
MIPVDPTRVTAPDGSTSELRVFTADDPRAPVMLCVPAMGVAASFYTPFAAMLQQRGFHVGVAELRGIGTSSVRASRRSDFGMWDLVASDLPAAVGHLRKRFEGSPIVLVGHSLGGQVSALAHAHDPALAEGLVLLASGPSYFRGWRFPRSAGVLAFTQLANVVARARGHFPGRSVGFAGREARGVIADWARVARSGEFRIARAPLDLEAALRRVATPVLAVSIAGDTFAPARAVDGLCAKMPRARIERWHYDPEHFGRKPLGHFHWVKQSDDIVTRIAAWADGAGFGAFSRWGDRARASA